MHTAGAAGSPMYCSWESRMPQLRRRARAAALRTGTCTAAAQEATVFGSAGAKRAGRAASQY